MAENREVGRDEMSLQAITKLQNAGNGENAASEDVKSSPTVELSGRQEMDFPAQGIENRDRGMPGNGAEKETASVMQADQKNEPPGKLLAAKIKKALKSGAL